MRPLAVDFLLGNAQMEQMAKVAKFYTEGGVLPSLPKGPDRDLMDYSDLL